MIHTLPCDSLICKSWLIGFSLLLGASAAAAAEFDHVQLNVAEPPAAAEWYVKHLGGRLLPVSADNHSGPARAVAFGKTLIRFSQAPAGTAGSVGSGIDHLGFAYDNLDDAMKRFASSGVEIVSGIEQEGPIRYAFIKDRWGTLIELVEDSEIRGFHHVHLATTDPRATLNWYVKNFGGRIERYKGLIGGVRYGDVWVLVKTVKRPPAATKGRAIDHASWAFANVDAEVKELKSRGMDVEASSQGGGGTKSAFVLGPDGVRIELVASRSAL